MTKKICFTNVLVVSFFLFSCKTIDLHPKQTYEAVIIESDDSEGFYEEEQEKQEIIEIIPEVVYVEKPIYVPLQEEVKNPAAGAASVKEHLTNVTKLPQTENGVLQKYHYHDDFVYEVHCQTYHTTDIQLEPGEEVLETPYISEPEVWEIGAGVSYFNGLPRQHFFIKPNYTNLISNLIIVTNRRVYHLELKSFNDYYMPIVRWTYPQIMPFTLYSTQAIQTQKDTKENNDSTINPEFLSFDYKIRYNFFRKPIWLPTIIYDDGAKTFVRLDERVLHKELPALFNEKNELLNYRVKDGSLLIVDKLIEKATLKLGKQKVSIEKKKNKEPKIKG